MKGTRPRCTCASASPPWTTGRTWRRRPPPSSPRPRPRRLRSCRPKITLFGERRPESWFWPQKKFRKIILAFSRKCLKKHPLLKTTQQNFEIAWHNFAGFIVSFQSSVLIFHCRLSRRKRLWILLFSIFGFDSLNFIVALYL